MPTALSVSMSEMFPNDLLLKRLQIGMKTLPQKMMASLLLSKGEFKALSVIFQGFGQDKLPINKSYAIMSVFPPPHPHTFDFHFKSRMIYPMIGNVQCTSGSGCTVLCR